MPVFSCWQIISQTPGPAHSVGHEQAQATFACRNLFLRRYKRLAVFSEKTICQIVFSDPCPLKSIQRLLRGAQLENICRYGISGQGQGIGLGSLLFSLRFDLTNSATYSSGKESCGSVPRQRSGPGKPDPEAHSKKQLEAESAPEANRRLSLSHGVILRTRWPKNSFRESWNRANQSNSSPL